ADPRRNPGGSAPVPPRPRRSPPAGGTGRMSWRSLRRRRRERHAGPGRRRRRRPPAGSVLAGGEGAVAAAVVEQRGRGRARGGVGGPLDAERVLLAGDGGGGHPAHDQPVVADGEERK